MYITKEMNVWTTNLPQKLSQTGSHSGSWDLTLLYFQVCDGKTAIKRQSAEYIHVSLNSILDYYKCLYSCTL